MQKHCDCDYDYNYDRKSKVHAPSFRHSHSAEICIHFHCLSWLRQARQRKIIQNLALWLCLRLCQFKISWNPYSRVRNKHSLMLINFLTFFQGLWPYSGLHRAYFISISIRYKCGYSYSFCQIFQELWLFKGLCLFRTLE